MQRGVKPFHSFPPHLWAALMLGAVSQVAQVLLIREFLMVFHGNELTMGLILASWLAWVGAGSRLGARLAGGDRDPLTLLAASAAGILAGLPAVIWCIRGLRGFLRLIPGTYLSLSQMALSCFVLMAPLCLLLGMQFVLIARIWRERDGAEDTSGAGKTYAAEGAGTMLGGLLFTFLFVRFLNPFSTAVLAGILLLASAMWLGRSSPGSPAVRSFPGLFLLAAALLSLPFWGNVDHRAHRIHWQSLTPRHQLVDTVPSKHGAISVLQREDQYSFFQSGHLIFSTAGREAAAPGLEEQEAVTFAHFALVQHPRPRNVLLIGGGLRGVLGEVLKHPVKKVDYIELDDRLTAAARPYVSPETLRALSDPRVTLIHIDGRLFIKNTGESYDLVLLDIPDPATFVLNRFYTREFFQEVRSVMEPDGVLVLGAGSSPDLRGKEVANRNTTLYHTLDRVFPDIRAAGEGFIYYFAANQPGQTSLEPSVLARRYRDRGIETEGFSSGHFATLLQDSSLRRTNWILRNHGRSPDAPREGPPLPPLFPGPVEERADEDALLPPVSERYFINSDYKPIGYFYTLMYWDAMTGSGSGETFSLLLRVQPWWIWPLCGLPVLIALALRAGARRSGYPRDAGFSVLFAVFTTGIATMSLQIALLFSFQSLYGFVYEMVGLIVAVFMGGLSLGTYVSHRYITPKDDTATLARIQLAIALLAVFIGLLLPRISAVPSPVAVFLLFLFFTFWAGFINGVDYPLACACLMAIRGKPDRAAAAVYGVELAGACGGAVLASVVVAPVLGITACCFMAGAFNGTAFIVLLISRRSALWQKKMKVI